MRSGNYPGQPYSHGCRHSQAGHNMPDPGADTHTNTHADTHTDAFANTNAHPLADIVKHVGHTGLSPGVASPARRN
ncbi:MAG: hypothetical protein ACM3ML_01820 [Micromonosporaceae bacterium]